MLFLTFLVVIFNMKDILVVEYSSWSIKRKQRDTSLQSPFKTWDHWRSLITEPCRGEKKSILKKTLVHSSSSGLTLPHHQEVYVSSVISCHVRVFICQTIVVNDVNYISKCIVKWKSKGNVEHEESCKLENS